MSSFSVRNYVQAERFGFLFCIFLFFLKRWKIDFNRNIFGKWLDQNVPHRFYKCHTLQSVNSAELRTMLEPLGITVRVKWPQKPCPALWGLLDLSFVPASSLRHYRDYPDFLLMSEVYPWSLDQTRFSMTTLEVLRVLCWKELKLQKCFGQVNKPALSRCHRWFKMSGPVSFPKFFLFPSTYVPKGPEILIQTQERPLF